MSPAEARIERRPTAEANSALEDFEAFVLDRMHVQHRHGAAGSKLELECEQLSVRGGRRLARRFTDVVGQPPMEYLIEWRLTLAADLILDPTETIASVAAKVGDRSPYALSAAFKRVRGIRPGRHRQTERLRVGVGDETVGG